MKDQENDNKPKTKWQLQHYFIYGWDEVDDELYDTEEQAMEALQEELKRLPGEPSVDPEHWKIEEVEIEDDEDEDM